MKLSPETNEHKKIKETVLSMLKGIYGAGLTEYPHTGNIYDVFMVTPQKIDIFVENIWTSTKSNFQYDLNILHRSLAKVKILIVNPKILDNNYLKREYEKTRISERQKGIAISDMIDGSRILYEPEFINEFVKVVEKLVLEALTKTEGSNQKSSKQIFEEEDWGIVDTPEKTRCLCFLATPSIHSESIIDMSQVTWKKITDSVPRGLSPISLNYYPTPTSYVIESAAAFVDAIPRRHIEVRKDGLVKFSYIELIKDDNIYSKKIERFLDKFLKYVIIIYQDISKVKIIKFRLGLAINKVINTQLETGNYITLDPWQKCSYKKVKIDEEIAIPFVMEEIINIIKQKIKLWFKLE